MSESASDALRSLDHEFAARCPSSRSRFVQAQQIFPSGVTHDARYFQPFPIYVDRAQGSRKWDLDGNEYIDYWMGHGALLLGHNRAEVVQAVAFQLGKGTHFSACHDLELSWGTLVANLVPSAERVRFLSSGTEATMMALRLARAYTGRSTIVKLKGHFHGWHDYATAAPPASYAVATPAGVPPATLSSIAVANPNNLDSVRVLLAEGDVAGMIVEPAGGQTGTVPLRAGFLSDLRRLCSEQGIVLIFDEVVTGFRMSPGGAQEYYGVLPDLTCLGKVLAGGLPGGALAGRREILELFEFHDDPHWNSQRRIPHPGTFNANPLSAAAGTATLEIAKTAEPQSRASELASLLRSGLNDAIIKLDLPGCVYGESSWFRILVGVECPLRQKCDKVNCSMDAQSLMVGMGPRAPILRKAMLLRGVDLMRVMGYLSSAHTTNDVERTVAAFDDSLRWMRQARLL